MSGAAFLDWALVVALGVLSVAFLLTVWRILRGPDMADRVLGLDMLVSIGIGFIVVIAIKTKYYLYLDVAISLGLVGFLATVAFARYIMQSAERFEPTEAKDEAEQNG